MFKRKDDNYKEEIYEMFARFGVDEKESNRLLNAIEIDRKRTEAAIVDLFLCFGIKKGLKPQHLLFLSERLGHKQFRANHLMERIKYLTECIVGSCSD